MQQLKKKIEIQEGDLKFGFHKLNAKKIYSEHRKNRISSEIKGSEEIRRVPFQFQPNQRAKIQLSLFTEK